MIREPSERRKAKANIRPPDFTGVNNYKEGTSSAGSRVLHCNGLKNETTLTIILKIYIQFRRRIAMNWDYLIIAAAIAASLAYLIRRYALRSHARRACGSSSSDCACCPQAAAKSSARTYNDN